MTPERVKSQSRISWAAVIAALAGILLFHFFGNASRGYVDTPSLFWWWISQWIDPNAETEHGWLILGLSVWLFWRNVRGAKAAQTRDTAAGPPFFKASLPLMAVIAALALHAIGFVAQQSRISIVALLLFTWAVVAMADRRWGRAAAFPLGFMVFAIPLNVLDTVGFWLRLGVIDASTAIAHFANLDVVRSGTQLFAPDGRYQYDVAAACSGVRSLMALTALSLLVGYLNFRATWRRALMLLLCFPLTYVGNVTRVTLIIFAAEKGGVRWGALVHDVMGYGIFAIVLGGVLGAAAIVRRIWPEKEPHSRESVHIARGVGPETFGRRWVPMLTCGATLILVGVEMSFLAQVSSSRTGGAAGVQLNAEGTDPVDLPAFIGTEWIGRRTEVSAVERAILPADTGFSRRTYISIEDRSHVVFLSVVLSGRDRTSIHRPEICLVGQGWTISSATQAELGWKSGREKMLPVTMLRASLVDPGSQREVRALMAYWFVSADSVVATHWQRFIRDAWNRVRHGRVDRWAYVLVQADAQDGELAALRRIQAILDETLPRFLVAGRGEP